MSDDFFNRNLPASINNKNTLHHVFFNLWYANKEFSQVELYAVWTGATQFPLSGFVHVKIIQLLAA